MFGSSTPATVVFDLAVDPAGASANYPIWRAPIACTINGFNMQSNKTQNAGTATVGQLVNFGTAGTAIKASGGTISASLGGTAAASRLTANVPARTTTMTNPYVAAGEYVTFAYAEEGAGWESGEWIRVQFDVVWGDQAENA
jgi:hypothetical protein